jgi:hypothetical protein
VSWKKSTYLHAPRPLTPAIPPVIPAAIKPENAPERREPEYRTAVRRTNSSRVSVGEDQEYQQ